MKCAGNACPTNSDSTYKVGAFGMGLLDDAPSVTGKNGFRLKMSLKSAHLGVKMSRKSG